LGHSANPNLAGLSGLLNPLAIYVSFETDPSPPAFLQKPASHRYRLMMARGATEENKIYSSAGSDDWFLDLKTNAIPIADNIILFSVFLRNGDPSDPPVSTWDSRANGAVVPQPADSAQLPLIADILMVAIDSDTAERLENGSSPPQPIADAIDGRFQDPSQLDSDLVEMERLLTAANVRFQIFRGSISFKESRWTR